MVEGIRLWATELQFIYYIVGISYGEGPGAIQFATEMSSELVEARRVSGVTDIHR